MSVPLQQEGRSRSPFGAAPRRGGGLHPGLQTRGHLGGDHTGAHLRTTRRWNPEAQRFAPSHDPDVTQQFAPEMLLTPEMLQRLNGALESRIEVGTFSRVRQSIRNSLSRRSMTYPNLQLAFERLGLNPEDAANSYAGFTDQILNFLYQEHFQR